ncbi:germination protein YpeB [Paenibacillus sp. J22TS3]|uniref:germination protein YpeB n=1 Tax=Paenibacillus sp. J22TS3 TaxID=2807192 RepID=UPI001B25AB6F|nr:germination protein YpeB [Paenibacillus sp. J22TS3]GIP20135.1 germination protein YpeB [Paenibacillus sp. J22TS3]
MYRRISAVLFPISALLLIGALIWGYQENQEKNSILIKAENQYQRAFHDLSYHVDRLHGEIGNTLAVHSASAPMHRKGLMNVWRLTSQAQNEINQLPLTLLHFNKTEDFLSKISKFSYQTANRDLTKKPLTESELKNLKELYKNSNEISSELQKVQGKVINNHLRWMDVESAMASESRKQDNTIIDGFKTVDKKVSEYPELDFGPSVMNIYNKRSVKKLGGAPATMEEIKKKAAQFAGYANPSNVQVVENGKGTEWPSFTANLPGRNNGERVSIDFTNNGGQVIAYNYTRQIGPRAIDDKTARNHASRFLVDKGYKNLEPIVYDPSDNIANMTYVTKKSDVLIYPEKISVRVALDNGQVVGLQATDYVYEKDQVKTVTQPKLSLEQARKYLNPDFKETYHRKALIENEQSEKVVTYEFGGRINGSQYRIYINGNSGAEESVEEIRSGRKVAALK